MPDDLISRDEAKKIITDEMQKCKEVGAIGAANTCHMLRAKIAALDAVPAAEGRWEKAMEDIDNLRRKLYGEGDTAGESALHTALAILDKNLTSSADAAQRERE
jgi:hypothetical protein